MKTNKRFFVVALLLSVSSVALYASKGALENNSDLTKTNTSQKSSSVQQKNSVVDTVSDMVKRSIAMPLSVAGVSSYFMYKVGTDIYTNYVQNYGSYITDAAITKSVEGIVPFNYGKGMSQWALTCMVGAMAFMTARKVAGYAPEIIRTPVEVVTRAVNS